MGASNSKNKANQGKEEKTTLSPYLNSGKTAGWTVLSAFGGALAGAAVGKFSFLAGLPLIFMGIHKKNNYITAAGCGMAVSIVPQVVNSKTTNGLEGFGKLPDEVNERVKYYFQNFKEKLFFPKSKPKEVSGLGESPTYFINPYQSVGEIDLSELDKIQNQVSSMQGMLPDFEYGYETEREF